MENNKLSNNIFIIVLNLIAISLLGISALFDFYTGAFLVLILTDVGNGLLFAYAKKHRESPELVAGGSIPILLLCEIVFLIVLSFCWTDKPTISSYTLFFILNGFFVAIGMICGTKIIMVRTGGRMSSKRSDYELKEEEAAKQIEKYKEEYLKDHTIAEWNEVYAEAYRQLAEKNRKEEEKRRALAEEWKNATPTGDYFSSNSYADGSTCKQSYDVCKFCIHKFERGDHKCVMYSGKVYRND